METEAILFLSQFAMVFLLGLQSLNVRDNRHGYAALTSLCIGLAAVCQWKLMPKASLSETLVWLAAGPLAIVCSMRFYARFGRKKGA